MVTGQQHYSAWSEEVTRNCQSFSEEEPSRQKVSRQCPRQKQAPDSQIFKRGPVCMAGL